MPDFTKRLGYGGSAVLDGVQVLVTGGSFESMTSPSYIEAASIQPFANQRGRILHASGTRSHSGSISFDVTETSLGLFPAMLKRGFTCIAGIHDGENSLRMTGVRFGSVSLTGAAGGVIACTASFQGVSAAVSGGVANVNLFNDEALDSSQRPLAYWQSGNVGVREWSFSMSQELTPFYGNLNSLDPLYLKVGLISYSLSVTTYEQVRPHTSISISTSAFSLQGTTTSRGYSYGGQTDLGSFTHTFETAASASAGAGDEVLS